VVRGGAAGRARALEPGDAQAAAVPEPLASRLLAERRVMLLADLRTPPAAERALGVPTVSAGVFVRADRRPGERELAAFTRAVLAAQERIAAGSAAALADKLPRTIVVVPDELAARVEHARGLYLRDSPASADRLDATLDLLRDQVPVAARTRVQVLPPGRIRTTPGR
jgi:ABC-type nitrate/sulfonate/bicarbonate transport system substrate-binding protein